MRNSPSALCPNSARSEIVRKLLFEFERLVQRFLKFLLRFAISGQSPFFMAASESFIAWEASLRALFRSLLIVLEPPVLSELPPSPEFDPDDESVPSVPEEPSLVSLVSVFAAGGSRWTFSASPADAPELPPNT